MNYFIKIFSNKPKEDINQIVEKMGYTNIAPTWSRTGGINHFLVKVCSLVNILFRMKKNDTLLIQYPLKKFYTPTCLCAHIKGGKVITLIHDLGSFRRKKLTAQQENRMLSNSDYIIAHNESMIKFLKDNGCKVALDSLNIFDYISPSKVSSYDVPHTPWRVVYAGGLSYKRNPFLYELDTHLKSTFIELYGKDFNETRAKDMKSMRYNGLLAPDDLLAKVEGDFGLVWDGDSLDECSGEWGEYLRINNPHKTSFYLRGFMPVIIWREAALAPFIEKEKIGICIDSLKDLDNRLNALTKDEYNEMRENAFRVGNKIAQGEFTIAALAKAESYLKRG